MTIHHDNSTYIISAGFAKRGGRLFVLVGAGPFLEAHNILLRLTRAYGILVVDFDFGVR